MSDWAWRIALRLRTGTIWRMVRTDIAFILYFQPSYFVDCFVAPHGFAANPCGIGDRFLSPAQAAQPSVAREPLSLSSCLLAGPHKAGTSDHKSLRRNRTMPLWNNKTMSRGGSNYSYTPRDHDRF